MNSSQTLLIGTGECGNRAISELKKMNRMLHAFFINTSDKDLENLDNVVNKYLFPMCDGSGGSRSNMKAILRQDENTFGLMKKLLGYKEQKYVYIFASTGGGTGSGSVFAIASMLNQIRPDMIVNIVAFLPFKSDSRIAHENTIEFWNELAKVTSDENSPSYLPNINLIYFVDNNKRRTKQEINTEVAESFCALFGMADSGIDGSLDEADAERLITGKGVSGIYHFTLPKTDLVECINDVMEESVFVVKSKYFQTIGLKIDSSFDIDDEDELFSTFIAKESNPILRYDGKETTLVLSGSKLNQSIIVPVERSLKRKLRFVDEIEESEKDEVVSTIKIEKKKPKKNTEQRKTIDQLLDSDLDSFFKEILFED